MKRWAIFAPFAGLVVYAGYLGLRASDLPSETDIINRYAADYTARAPEGARLTDCAATTHPGETVRMVINCTHPNGDITSYLVGPHGQLVPHMRMEEPAT